MGLRISILEVLGWLVLLAFVAITVFYNLERKRLVIASPLDIAGTIVAEGLINAAIFMLGVFVLGFVTALTAFPLFAMVMGDEMASRLDILLRATIMLVVIHRRETAWKR